jgi:hypothetical protein
MFVSALFLLALLADVADDVGAVDVELPTGAVNRVDRIVRDALPAKAAERVHGLSSNTLVYIYSRLSGVYIKNSFMSSFSP